MKLLASPRVLIRLEIIHIRWILLVLAMLEGFRGMNARELIQSTGHGETEIETLPPPPPPRPQKKYSVVRRAFYWTLAMAAGSRKPGCVTNMIVYIKHTLV